MKSIRILLALSIVMLLAPAAYAANSTITVYPQGVLQGSLAGEYEWRIDSDLSQTLTLSGARLEDDEISGTILAGGIGLRKYIEGNVFDGLYVGASANLSWANWVEKATDEKKNGFILDISGLGGYKLRITDNWAIDLGVSATLPIITTASYEDTSGGAFGAGPVRLGFVVGLSYAW